MQHQRPLSPLSVFCAAAPSDTTWLAQWETHLRPLIRSGQITVSSERHLMAGESRLQQINDNLDLAHAIIFLLSPDFFASDECLALMERALEGSARVIPLLLRSSDWKASRLAHFVCLPANGQFVTTWDNLDQAFQTCVDDLRHLLGLPAVESTDNNSASIADDLKTYLQRLYQDLSALPPYLHNLDRFDIDSIGQQVRISRKRLIYREKEEASLSKSAHQAGYSGKETEQERKTDQKHQEKIYLRRGTDMDEQLEEEVETVVVEWGTVRSEIKRAIILGDPGFGKSWLLRYEGRQLAQEQIARLQTGKQTPNEIIFPVHLRLATLAKKLVENPSNDIRETIVDILQFEYALSEQLVIWIKHIVVSSQCVLLLDALDEVTEAQKPELFAALKGFAEHTHCRILLTSRIAGYTGAPFALNVKDREQELELVGFNKEQITRFTECWFAKEAQQGKQLLEVLFQEPALRTLARIPLLLSFICMTSRGNEAPPPTRGKLYESTLRRLLRGHWRPIELQERDEGRLENKLAVLEQVAWHFATHRGQWRDLFPAHELNRLIQQTSEDAYLKQRAGENHSLLHELSERDGILVKAGEPYGGPDNIPYIFLHRTFHEYLVAQYLSKLQTEEWLEHLKPHLWFDSDWEIVIVLLAGFPDVLFPLLKMLLQEPSDPFHTLLLLAGRCLAEGHKNGMTREAEGIIIKKLLRLLYSASKLDRNRTLRVLGQIGQPAAEDLLAILQKEKYERAYAREAAAEALCLMNTPDVTEALLDIVRSKEATQKETPPSKKAILDEKSYQIFHRQMLDTVKGEPRGWRIVESFQYQGKNSQNRPFPLSQTVLKKKDIEYQDTRIMVARVLGTIGNDYIALELLKLLKDTKEWHHYAYLMRQTAASALGQIGGPLVIKELLEILIAHQNPRTYRPTQIHETIMEESTGPYTSLEWLIEPSGLNILIKARLFPHIPVLFFAAVSTQYRDMSMRNEIIEALSHCGSSAIEGLLTLLQTTPHEDLYLERLYREMLQVLEPQLVRDLRRALPNQHADILRVAGRVLEKMEERLLLDKDKALDTSQPIDPVLLLPQLQFRLLEALKHAERDHVFHRRVVFALGKIGDQRAIQALLHILQDKANYWYLRGTALNALWQSGDPRAVEPLLQVLRDKDEFKRHDRAIWALGKFGVASAVPDLIQILCPQDYSQARSSLVRAQAAEALGEIGGEMALEALLGILEEKDQHISRTAAIAVGHIGTAQTALRLLQMLRKRHIGKKIATSTMYVLRHRGNFSAMKHAFGKELQKWREGNYSDTSQMAKIALVVLGQFRKYHAEEVLLPLLHDKDREIRQIAAVALGQSAQLPREGRRSLEQDVLALYQNKEEDRLIREAALMALGWSGTPRAIRGLSAALRDKEWSASALVALEIVVKNGEPERCCQHILHLWSHKALGEDIRLSLYELLYQLAPRLRLATGNNWPAWYAYLTPSTNRVLQMGMKRKLT